MTSYEGLEKHRWVLVLSNSWQLCIKQQYIIEFWLICFRLTLESFSLVPYCMGKEYPRVDVKAFCNVLREAGGDEGWRMAFRDATPETWCTQSHCLIRLSIQLTLLYHQGQGSNQFNMEGEPRSGCSPHTNTSNTGLDTWDTEQW